jgi:SAM-dependent methyltransferase
MLCKYDSVIKMYDVNVSDLCTIYSSWLSYDMSSEFGNYESISYLECPNCGLKFFSPAITGSNEFYEALSKNMGNNYYQEDKSEYQFAGNLIGDDDSVLDIGSGRGHFAKFVRGTYVGLDFNPSAIEQAQADGIKVINESIEEHTKKTISFYSVITAFQVIEHVAKPGDFIQTCLKALRPGGILILSVPSEESFVGLLDNAVLNMPPHHVSRWDDKALSNVGKIFSLTLVAKEHEILSEIHFETFITVIANTTVRSLLNWKRDALVDLSFKQRIVNRLGMYLKPLCRKVFGNHLLWPRGHSVTVAYRKAP